MLHTTSFTKIRLFTLLIAIISIGALASLAHAQDVKEPVFFDIEPVSTELPVLDGLYIIDDSCVLNLESGLQAPFSEPDINLEDKPVSVQCEIANNTGQEIYTQPTLTLKTTGDPVEEVVIQTEDTYILFPGDETQTVLFVFPEATTEGRHSITIALTGEFETKTLSSEDVGKDNSTPPPVYTATPEEENTVLYVVVTLLALLILLAILVYQRKSKEPLPEMHNPEN